jgi:hypothetical protein
MQESQCSLLQRFVFISLECLASGALDTEAGKLIINLWYEIKGDILLTRFVYRSAPK